MKISLKLFPTIVIVFLFALFGNRTKADYRRMFTRPNNQERVVSDIAPSNINVNPQDAMLAILTAPGSGKNWQGYSTYSGGYTTLFVGYNGLDDWPHCSGSIERMEIRSRDGGPEIIEEFNDPGAFSQIGSTVYISKGKVVWDNLYRSGGLQYVYRSIPTFKGPVEIKLVGQVDWWENNCGAIAGIADDNLLDPAQSTWAYPGIAYLFHGGGCCVQAPVIFASGTNISDAYISDGCSYTPYGAPWFAPGTPYEANLVLTRQETRTFIPITIR